MLFEDLKKLVYRRRPIEIIGNEKVESIKFEKIKLEGNELKNTGEITQIDCGLVITAIGYKPKDIDEWIG